MKIKIKNLGALKQAEFELGELTIICGLNNTGKTYATYATYGFLDFWKSAFEIDIDQHYISTLMEKGTITLNLKSYAGNASRYIKKASEQYSKVLDRVFAGKKSLFQAASFEMEDIIFDNYQDREVNIKAGSVEKSIIQILKLKGSDDLSVSLMVEKEINEAPPRHFVERIISDGIKEALFKSSMPRPFIASAERTGSSIFQKELDFTRNRLIELLGDKSAKINPVQLLGRFSAEYSIPVRKNVDFIRELPNITNRESFILLNHPNILNIFADIIGGEYKVSRDGEIQFIPNTNKRIKLSLVESSSAVRSLLDIGFYLRHIASPGDLLMVDEPELNLHPENQRRVARLFSCLVNLGIKVFITTHSDYIIKELNTLIMLNHDKINLRQIANDEGYRMEELLSAEKVRVYMAERALIKLDENFKKAQYPTLTRADINQELGIEARSFDNTIDEMNRIQEMIIFSGEEA